MNDLHRQFVEILGTAQWQIGLDGLTRAGQAALPSVIEGLSHSNPQTRKWCAGILDHFGDASCVPALLKAIRDPSVAVRRHALHALGCQACKAAPLSLDIIELLLPMALSDASIRVRRAAVHMLGNQPPDARVSAALLQSMQTETDAKWLRVCRWTLAQHAGDRPQSLRCEG